MRTCIQAPIERCFDLARSIDFHVQSMSHSGEKAVGGATTGLIGLGQEVTWRARHVGHWQTLTSRISGFDRPHHFQDCMVKGAFKSFIHDHNFRSDGHSTIMDDVFVFESPYGFLGRLANVLFLSRYMMRLLAERAQRLKLAAESDEWRKYLSATR